MAKSSNFTLPESAQFAVRSIEKIGTLTAVYLRATHRHGRVRETLTVLDREPVLVLDLDENRILVGLELVTPVVDDECLRVVIGLTSDVYDGPLIPSPAAGSQIVILAQDGTPTLANRVPIGFRGRTLRAGSLVFHVDLDMVLRWLEIDLSSRYPKR